MMKKNSPTAIVLNAAVCTFSILCLSGCLGYNLGSTIPHDIETIAVPTFKNQTAEPLIEVSTTDATIAQFQFDGSVKVTEEAVADAILEVTLNEYKLYPITYDSKRTTRTQEYRVKVFASITLIRRSTDEVVLDDPQVVGEATFYLTGDMSSSKRRTLPDLSEDLARHIVDAVTQTWQ